MFHEQLLLQFNKPTQSEPNHLIIRIENNIFKTFDVPLVHAQ